MEELSMRSFLAHGHEYHLYTYDRIDNVPEGVCIKDANYIIPSAKIFKYSEYDSYSGFSNHFRYRLLLQKGGWWADTDLICLRPFDFQTEYVFSSQAAQEGDDPREAVNVGAIKSPPGSRVLKYAWDVCQSKDPATLSWGEIGPLLLAKAVQELGLGAYVRRAADFCPIPWFRWKGIIDPDHQSGISDETYAVHLWNEMWRRGGFDKDEEYDAACLYERLKARYLERPAFRISVNGSRDSAQETTENTGSGLNSASFSSPLPSVSAVVLTRNSEARLARCLESIQRAAFADEIVVCVDASTTDRTFSVAKRFTSHVHMVTTEGYLESALEKIAAFCSGDFILRIDDDESLGGNWDKASFQLLAAFNHFAQVWLPRRWLVPPGDSFIAANPWFPDLQLRLFANEPDTITWPKRVHEEMSVAGRSIILFDRWIDHHTFLDRPRGERRRRCEEYRRLNPQQDFNYFYLYENLEYTTLPCSTGAIAAASASDSLPQSVFCYPLGSPIEFSIEGNGIDYTGKGWGLPESWGTWTVSEQADIHLPLGSPLGCGAILSAEVMPFLTPLHPTLLVSVVYQDTLIGEWSFDRAGSVALTLNIGANLIAADSSPHFHFRITDPRSPAETSGSMDTRLLGLGFKSLCLQRQRDTVSADDADSAGVNGTGSGGRPPSLTGRLNSRERLIAKAIRLGRRVLPNIDLDVFWQDMWIFRVGDYYFPVPEVTEPEEWLWHELAGAAARYLQQAEDNWYRVYRPKPGDVVVDIGAGRGEDTCAFSRAVGGSGRVLAIEAHPVSFAVLKKFCLWNGLSNVTALNLACADKTGKLQIETSSNWTSNYTRGGEPSTSGFAVDGVPFDCIWESCGIGRIDFLKMNIEGAERLALIGCRRALEHTRNISVAAHDHRADRGEAEWFRTGDFVRSFLRDSGFHLVPRDDPRSWARGHVHGIRPDCQ
jgi:FkbM family methyltransferase